MRSLLSLPQEVLDQIIECSICHSVSSPKTPNEALESGQYAFPTDMTAWLGQKCKLLFGVQEPVMYPIHGSPLAPIVDPTNLLLTCKQLKEDTLAAIKRIPREIEVDVLLVDEKYLIATWIFVPPYAPRFEWFTEEVEKPCNKVKFIIRPFGIWNGNGLPGIRPEDIGRPHDSEERNDEDEDEDTWSHLRSIVNGFSIQEWYSPTIVPGSALSGFSNLFERFLRGGASGMPLPSPTFDIRHKIHEATIMVMTPHDAVADQMFSGFSPSFAPEKRIAEPEKANWMIHPSVFKETLVEWFEAIPNIQLDPNQPKNLTAHLNKLDQVHFGVDDVVESIFVRMQATTNDGSVSFWIPSAAPDMPSMETQV